MLIQSLFTKMGHTQRGIQILYGYAKSEPYLISIPHFWFRMDRGRGKPSFSIYAGYDVAGGPTILLMLGRKHAMRGIVLRNYDE